MDAPFKHLCTPTGRGFALAIVVASLLTFTSEGKAEPQNHDLTEFRARIVEIYGDKAIVEVDGRRFLVESIQSDRPFPGDVGSEIQILGRSRGNVLLPSRITLPSGVSFQRPAVDPGAAKQPGQAQDRSIEAQLRDHGITVVGRPYRRRNYTIVEGRADDGRSVIALFDRGLRLEEIEEAEHRHIHPRSPEALPEAEVARRLASQGYSSIRLIDQSRFRFLYSVTGPRGQQMELHVGRGGSILRRVWLR
jgi:hypothetical protein